MLRRSGGLLLFVTMVACGASETTGGQTHPDAAGPIVIVTDGSFQPIDFDCGGGTPAPADVRALDVSGDAPTCTVANPNVGFRTNVLPVLSGCSGELCHAPWSYRTTVGIVSHECCDGRKLIDPRNPSQSYVLQKIRGVDLCGNSSRMGNIAPAVANDIADWICLGAPDN